MKFVTDTPAYSLLRPIVLLTALCAGSVFQHPAFAAESPEVTRYRATTTNLEPAGLDLRFDVLTWSGDTARAAVVDALQSEDPAKALGELPTVGYVWPEGSPVGYALKYAHTAQSGSGERLTFVTSRELGSYDFRGWTVTADSNAEPLEYTVIELDLTSGGESTGTASLAAAVELDAPAGLVRLERNDGTPVLFSDARRVESAY